MDDKISVLMSVYKNEKGVFLKEAIDSIVNQTLQPYEFVIVKDGILPKELNDVIDAYKSIPYIKVYGYEKNQGLGLALKYGIDKCKGNIIARMDSDDISRHDRLEIQYSILKSEDYDIVGSNTNEFENTIDNIISKRIMPEFESDIRQYSKGRNPFIHPSIMMKKEKVLEAGSYRDYYLCEDYDLWVRMLEINSKPYNIQDTLVYMRVSKDFYKRRGGFKYMKAIVGFKKMLYKKKYYTRGQYIKTKYATIFVALMPGFLRSFIYKKVLRK